MSNVKPKYFRPIVAAATGTVMCMYGPEPNQNLAEAAKAGLLVGGTVLMGDMLTDYVYTQTEWDAMDSALPYWSLQAAGAGAAGYGMGMMGIPQMVLGGVGLAGAYGVRDQGALLATKAAVSSAAASVIEGAMNYVS